MARMRIGEMLVQQGRLDSAQLQSALAHQRRWGGRLGRAIVALGFMQERALLDVLGAQLGVPVIDIGDRFIPPHVATLVPERLVRTRRVLPIARLSESRRGPLVVALSDPADLGVLDEIAFATGMEVKPALAGEGDLDQAIARHYGGPVAPPPARGFADREDAIELPDDGGPGGTSDGDLH
jgi:type IV pilus assembly protein PilB